MATTLTTIDMGRSRGDVMTTAPRLRASGLRHLALAQAALEQALVFDRAARARGAVQGRG